MLQATSPSQAYCSCHRILITLLVCTSSLIWFYAYILEQPLSVGFTINLNERKALHWNLFSINHNYNNSSGSKEGSEVATLDARIPISASKNPKHYRCEQNSEHKNFSSKYKGVGVGGIGCQHIYHIESEYRHDCQIPTIYLQGWGRMVSFYFACNF